MADYREIKLIGPYRGLSSDREDGWTLPPPKFRKIFSVDKYDRQYRTFARVQKFEDFIIGKKCD